MGETVKMAKVELTPRERYALFAIMNSAPCSGRAEQKRLDRIWNAINLDEISTVVMKKPQSGAEAFDHERKTSYPVGDVEFSSDDRDVLIAYTELAMQGWAAKLLYQVGSRLIRSRDGET